MMEAILGPFLGKFFMDFRRKTLGNSIIVSPDGKILKSLNKKEGVITVSIDPSLPKKLRSIIPSLKKD